MTTTRTTKREGLPCLIYHYLKENQLTRWFRHTNKHPFFGKCTATYIRRLIWIFFQQNISLSIWEKLNFIMGPEPNLYTPCKLKKNLIHSKELLLTSLYLLEESWKWNPYPQNLKIIKEKENILNVSSMSNEDYRFSHNSRRTA